MLHICARCCMPRYHVGGDFEHIEPMLREAHALEPDNSTISRGLALVLQAYTRARARTNARARARTHARARARVRAHTCVHAHTRVRAHTLRCSRSARSRGAMIVRRRTPRRCWRRSPMETRPTRACGSISARSTTHAGLQVSACDGPFPGPAHRQANRNRSICVALRCGHRCRAKARRLRTKCLKPRRAAPHRRCLRQTSAAGRGDAREW